MAWWIVIGLVVGVACVTYMRYKGPHEGSHIQREIYNQEKLKRETTHPRRSNCVEAKPPESQIGDQCKVCSKVLTKDDLKRLSCKHALHYHCYYQRHVIKQHTDCIYCGENMVNESKVGDLCAICMEKLPQDDFKQLICMHAMHYECFNEWYIEAGRDSCVICDVKLMATKGKIE